MGGTAYTSYQLQSGSGGVATKKATDDRFFVATWSESGKLMFNTIKLAVHKRPGP
jgi:hypothetical protein